MIDPWRSAAVGGAIGWICGAAKISSHREQAFLETDLFVEARVEIGRIEQGAQQIGERLRWRRIARGAPDQGDGG